ncbi:Fur family transcriptional regulator [Clostridium weizhouense]|uniref:Transcriptional repressor n=1 Tax=Clostridium weizhouense TaxID=2859781 RepID=A0ABS7AM20_9CLOT|nr:transcriptional repressor [Clostridium weizhouense]MBW6409609.1 transcriptional repressor [Clostridium weizhouense]
MDKDLSFYKKLFKKKGYKFTIQKQLILLEIINSNTHLSVKEIYERIKKNNVGIATVYRSLKLFNELNIIKEINTNNISYYEMKIFSKKPLHIHFKCSKCNDVIDIDDRNLNLEFIKLNKKVEKESNVEVNDVNIMLIGLCDKCKANKKCKD